jgi:hypothetical protein
MTLPSKQAVSFFLRTCTKHHKEITIYSDPAKEAVGQNWTYPET